MPTEQEETLKRELEKTKAELASTKSQLAATPDVKPVPKVKYWTSDVEDAGRYLAAGAPLVEVVERVNGSPRMGKKFGFSVSKAELDALVDRVRKVGTEGA